MTELAENALMNSAGVALQPHAGATAAAQHAMAQIQARTLVAVSRPRDLDAARVRMLADCKRPRFAEKARYEVKNRGSGLSIRFAESILRNYGNLYCEAITVDDTRESITVRVAVTDLETNACNTRDVTVAKTVERKRAPKNEAAILDTRFNTYGEMLYILRATSDDMLGKVNAQISKALRTLLIKFVPFDIVEECEDQVLDTIENAAAKDPDAEKKRVVDAFAAMGVTPSDLAEYLGKSLARLQPTDILRLKQVYVGLRDGELTWEEIMEDAEPEQAAEGVTNAMDAKPEAEAEAAPADDEPIVDPAELEKPAKQKAARPKKKLLDLIDALGCNESEITSTATDMFSADGKAILDIGDLKPAQLERLLGALSE